jgi:type VI secretion system protein VasG
VVGEIASRCTEVESGARNVDNILTNTMLPEISREILGRLAEGQRPDSVHVGFDGQGLTYNLNQCLSAGELLASHSD